MAYGLDTDSFLKCFVRMTSRRGYPQEIVSDRGTNFVGADRELRKLVSGMDTNKIQDQTASKGLKWCFNPPLAPHFGGVHEAMIKAAKKAIRAILSNADINDEELMTTFIGVEALLNSRPLTYQSADSKDATPLTPPTSIDKQEAYLHQNPLMKLFSTQRKGGKSSRTDFSLLEEMVKGVASIVERPSKMERNPAGSENWRCCPRHLTRKSQSSLAPCKSTGSFPRPSFPMFEW